jgi:hypothetical protein
LAQSSELQIQLLLCGDHQRDINQEHVKQTRTHFSPHPTNRYIAVADIEHTGFTTQYTEAYPDAKVYGPEGAASKLGINVHEWTADKNHNPMEYDSQVLKDEIKSEYFDGFINKVG